jgi:hypothetical protein
VSSNEENATKASLVKRYRLVFFALVVLCLGITMVTVSSSFLTVAQSCENYDEKNFWPSSVITATCTVSSAGSQELIFYAFFYSSAGNVAGGETIQLPAHLEIKDPNNVVLYDLYFDDRMSISFKPETTGMYTATITSLQTDYHPIWKQTTNIVYSFGLATHSSLEVYAAIGVIGYLVTVFGVIFVFVSAIKAGTRRKSTLIFD